LSKQIERCFLRLGGKEVTSVFRLSKQIERCFLRSSRKGVTSSYR
jgi:hypothetical protein